MWAERLHSALLGLLPAITMLVGGGLAGLWDDAYFALGREVAALVAVAALAPLVAASVLQVVVRGFDLVLVSVSAMLISIGTSTLVHLAAAPGGGQPFYAAIAMRHVMFVGLGSIALIVGAMSAHRVDKIRRYPFTLLGLALLLTAVTVAFGETINGARLWLRLGPIQFLPSEITRLLLVVFVASYLYERRHLIAAPWRLATFDLPPAPYLLPLVGAVVGAVVILVLQNDLGMAALVVLGAFAAVAGVVRSRSSLGLGGAVLAIAAGASFAATPRVQDRVSGWLDAWRDPAGRGFQFVQAEYSLAAGGLTGYPEGPPAANVPEVHTDFAVVAVGSQFGWLGAAAVLVLAAVLVCRCALVALRASDPFRSLLAFSLSGLFGIQVILITGGTLRVMPLTGLTFPLLSYGGTSMVATMFALGVAAGLNAPRGRPGSVE